MKYNKIIILTVLAAFAVATPLVADIYVEKQTAAKNSSGNDADQSWTTKMWISDKYIRVEEPEGKTYNITDFEKGLLITVDTENKEYFTIDLSQVQQDFIRGTAQLRNRMKMDWRIEDGVSGEQIAGFDTVKVGFYGFGSVDMNGSNAEQSIRMVLWYSDQISGVENTSEKLIEVMGLDKNPFLSAEVVEEIKRIGGFPLKAVIENTISGKKQSIEQTVTNIETVTVEPQFYQVPDGYTEVSAAVSR